MAVDYLGFGYAAAVTCGGFAGFVKAGSYASLVAGLLSGAALAYGSYQMSKDPKNQTISIGANLVIAGVMGLRFFSYGKFMPSGLVTCLSLMMLARHGARAYGIIPVQQ